MQTRLNVSEAAKLLGVHVGTLRKRTWRDAVGIPTRHLGRGKGKLIFIREELERFLQKLPKE